MWIYSYRLKIVLSHRSLAYIAQVARQAHEHYLSCASTENRLRNADLEYREFVMQASFENSDSEANRKSHN